jgi:hypothetical protein
VFAYLVFARAGHAHRSLWLLADQIRDWRIALGPASSLPLVGTPSTAGGSSLGPIYYWILWLSRVVIGPWVQNLPHAGVYGIALLQGAADLFLLDAIRRRTGTIWIGLAVVLLAATAPHDLAISGTIWNPSVSVAFIKIAMALRLLDWTSRTLWGTAATTAAAWLAVQAHSAAVFAAFPIVASYVAQDVVKGRMLGALQQARASAEVILLLQVPYLLHALISSGETAPTRALAGASQTLSTGSLRIGASAAALGDFVVSILFAPWRWAVWVPLLIVCAVVVAVRYVRDLPVIAVTIAPLLTTVAGFSVWPGNYDEYWYLPFAPCAALVLVLAMTSWKPRLVAPAICIALAIAQPVRITTARGLYPMPQYGPLVRGSQRVLRQGAPVRRLETTMAMPPLSDETFPYVAMGGRFSDDAGLDAVIDHAGNVQFKPVRPAR